MHHLRSTILFLLIAAAVAYPPLATIDELGIAAPFRYFAPDTFYYLTIATHSAGASGYSFDGTFPTNGFHPLWEYILTSALGSFSGPRDQGAEILFVFYSGIVLTSIGMGLVGLAIRRITGSFTLAIFGAIPGAYWMLFSHLNPNYGAAWSFVNGMESPLSIFFFGVLLAALINFRLLHTPSPGRIVVISLLVLLLTLSRLDDVFIVPPFLAVLFRIARTRREGIVNAAIGSILPLLGIGTYLLYNIGYAGMALPISGISKSGPSLTRATHDLIGVMIPVPPFSSSDVWEDLTLRALQMAIPIVVAVFWLALLGREGSLTGGEARSSTRYMRLMVGVLCAYAATKGLYNFINVAPWHQGHWYYPLSIITCNIVCAMLLRPAINHLRRSDPFELALPLHSRLILPPLPVTVVAIVSALLCLVGALVLAGVVVPHQGGASGYGRLIFSGSALISGLGTLLTLPAMTGRIRRRTRRKAYLTLPVLPPLVTAGTLAMALLSANVASHGRLADRRGERYHELWERRGEIARQWRAAYGGAGIIEIDDGILAYSLGFPAMNGMGLTLDREAYRSVERGHLLDIAYRRGFRALASLVYITLDSTALANSDTLGARLALVPYLARQGTERWRFSVLHRDAPTGLTLIGFSPGP